MNAAFGAATSKLMTISPKSSYEAVGDKELAGVFGTGSLYHMIRYAQKGADRNYPIDVLLIKELIVINNCLWLTFFTTTITAADAGNKYGAYKNEKHNIS